MPQRTLFKAQCASCSAELWRPHASEHGYGAGIFYGVDGTVFAVVDFLDEHRDVVALIDEVLVHEDLVTRDMFELCATLADPIDDQPLVGHFVCSHCGSSKVAHWGGERRDPVEVPYATFIQFLALTPDERRAEVRRIVKGRPSLWPPAPP